MKNIILGLIMLTGLINASDMAFDGSYWAMTYYRGNIDFSEWKKLGVNSCMIYKNASGAPAAKAGFPFYNEYVLPQIGWDSKAKSQYENMIAEYFEDGNKEILKRVPSLSDPAYWEDSKKIINNIVGKQKNYNPLAYSIGDESSVTSYAKPFDFDFSDTALSAMRVWLKDQYGTIENLNKEWNTAFTGFGKVVPFTTDQAKEKQSRGEENYAPWADHRTFMESSFADFVNKCMVFSQAVDPKTPAGIVGCQGPSTFGGYDWWKLCNAMNFIEAYDIGNNVDMIRSFTDTKKVFNVSTTFNGAGEGKRKIWERFLQGDRGTIIYDETVNNGTNKVVTGLKDLFLELNSGISKKIYSAERKSDPVAIHYSQASVHAEWMLETGLDKVRNWVQWKEAATSRFSKNRNGWVKVIKDLGLQFKFVAYEQIESGELIKGGYKVFVMPESVAISEKEAKAIEEFVNAGGVVIGDCQIATMDEHCKRLKEGRLDKLFGIKRNGFDAEGTKENLTFRGSKLESKAAESGISLADGARTLGSAGAVPAVIINETGKGKAIYLNFYLSSYAKLRLQPPREKPVRDIIGSLLLSAGINSRVSMLDINGAVSGYEVVWFKTDSNAEYLAIIRNAAVIQDELGAAVELIKAGGKKAVKIILPKTGKITDLRTNKEVGAADYINTEIEPYEPVIYSIIWE